MKIKTEQEWIKEQLNFCYCFIVQETLRENKKMVKCFIKILEDRLKELNSDYNRMEDNK